MMLARTGPSAFTNAPLHKTINIILEQIYKEKLVNRKLRKNTLKKLIKIVVLKLHFPLMELFVNRKTEF